jgi:3-phenylpropionate/trans-cinnamate dioxygenase ferredoxin reductase subunit
MVVGDESEKRFSVISYRENAMVAVESVNRAADHVAARKLLQSGRRLNVSAVAEPGFELKLFAAKESVHASEYSDTSPNVNT